MGCLNEIKATLQRHDDELVAAMGVIHFDGPKSIALENELASEVQRVRRTNQDALEWIYRHEREG